MKICHVIQIKFKQSVEEKCPHDHSPTEKAYLSDNRVADISKSFTHKMAVKTSWHRYTTKLRHCHPICIITNAGCCYTDVVKAGLTKCGAAVDRGQPTVRTHFDIGAGVRYFTCCELIQYVLLSLLYMTRKNTSFTVRDDLIKHHRIIWGHGPTAFGMRPSTSLIRLGTS